MNRKPWIALAALVAGAALIPSVQAQSADKGDWLVRARALYLDPANKGTDLDLAVDTKTFPELDVSYFLTPNLALELVLTYPQKHDVTLAGTKIGTLKHLPPTLSLQYHFTGLPVRPYVGAGVNYTHFSNVDLPAGVEIEKNSVGLALGGGLDVPFGGGWVFNVDIKKVQIRTDVTVAGTNHGTFKVDPVLYSIGIGKRF